MDFGSPGTFKISGRPACARKVRWDTTWSRPGVVAVVGDFCVTVASTRTSGGGLSRPVRKARTMGACACAASSAIKFRVSSSEETAPVASAPSCCLIRVNAPAAVTYRKATPAGTWTAAQAPNPVIEQRRTSRCAFFIVCSAFSFVLLLCADVLNPGTGISLRVNDAI